MGGWGGEWVFLFFPGKLGSLPMHSPPHTWDLSTVSSGRHLCFYLWKASVKVKLLIETVWVSAGPSRLYSTYHFSPAVWVLRIWSLASCKESMTLISSLGQPRAGTDDRFGNQEILERVHPSVSAWHPQGDCMLAESPRSPLLALQVQILSIIRSPRANQALGDQSH